MESIKKVLLSLIILSLYCISSNAVVRVVIDKKSVAAVTANTAIQSSIEIIHNKTLWKSHTNLTHPGKYFRPSKVKIMRPTSPK